MDRARAAHGQQQPSSPIRGMMMMMMMINLFLSLFWHTGEVEEQHKQDWFAEEDFRTSAIVVFSLIRSLN